MSGRLIILPKKSYCPWKPENVERVLRDERRAKEENERQQAEQQQHESRQRRTKLKHTRRIAQSGAIAPPQTEGSSASRSATEHVNLFAVEEKAMLHVAFTGQEKERKPNVGVMPVRLDQVKVQGGKPFYVRRERRPVDPTRENGRKARMDPMNAFVSHVQQDSEVGVGQAGPDSDPSGSDPVNDMGRESEVGLQQSLPRHARRSVSDGASRTKPSRKSRHRLKRSSRADDCESTSASDESSRRTKRQAKKHRRVSRRMRTDDRKGQRLVGTSFAGVESIEELRRRRQEREQIEGRREAALMSKTGSHDRDRRYQNQYNPGLSRR